MTDQDRQAIEHLKKAAALIELGASAHFAFKVDAIAKQLETHAAAQADYRKGRGETPGI